VTTIVVDWTGEVVDVLEGSGVCVDFFVGNIVFVKKGERVFILEGSEVCERADVLVAVFVGDADKVGTTAPSNSFRIG
jgi:hypothetical protein